MELGGLDGDSDSSFRTMASFRNFLASGVFTKFFGVRRLGRNVFASLFLLLLELLLNRAVVEVEPAAVIIRDVTKPKLLDDDVSSIVVVVGCKYKCKCKCSTSVSQCTTTSTSNEGKRSRSRLGLRNRIRGRE